MKQQSKGFTLIELVTVMLIVAIMMIFIGIKLPSTATYSLSSVTEQIRRDIRYTQTLAISLKNDTGYSLVISANSYSISPSPPDGAYTVTMPSGVTLSAVTITFDSMGAPASAATVTVTASGVASYTLTVSPETGFVSG